MHVDWVSNCSTLEVVHSFEMQTGRLLIAMQVLKVTGYSELYDFIYVYIYATKTGIKMTSCPTQSIQLTGDTPSNGRSKLGISDLAILFEQCTMHMCSQSY